MNLIRTLATTERVLKQLRHDKRTIALVIFVPCLLMILVKYIFYYQPGTFNSIAPMMLGIFPLFMMFLVTSIAMLRERTSGTLDKLMTQPLSKTEFVFGYAIAFTILGLLQACVVSLVTLGFLDVTVLGGTIPVLIAAAVAAFLGTTLGLFVSAFATTEFQAVQLVMPILMPQVLLCGLFVARDQMVGFLETVSDFLPMTYSVEAMKQVAMNASWTAELSIDLLIVFFAGIAALILGSVTIKRQV